MSVLPNSTNVTPTVNFWGAGGGGGYGNLLAVVPQPTTPFVVSNLPPGDYLYFPLFTPGLEFPLDTQMTVTLNFIFDSSINFDEFTVGMEQDGVVEVSSTVDLHNQKGVFGMSLVAFFENPANTPINLQGFIRNTTATTNDLTVPTSVSFTNIIVAVPQS